MRAGPGSKFVGESRSRSEARSRRSRTSQVVASIVPCPCCRVDADIFGLSFASELLKAARVCFCLWAGRKVIGSIKFAFWGVVGLVQLRRLWCVLFGA